MDFSIFSIPLEGSSYQSQLYLFWNTGNSKITDNLLNREAVIY